MTEQHLPTYGPHGQPCSTCSAPLAGDQRYCLTCGDRRPEAELAFLDVLAQDVREPGATAIAPGVATVAAAEPSGLNARLRANGPILGLGGVLVGILIAGLLLGHWATGSSSSATAPARPQVIRVAGSAQGSAAPAAAAAPAATTRRAKKKAQARAKKATVVTTKALKGTTDVKSLSSKKAIDDAVKKGKPISTGTGKLPPKDNKAPGNGSSIEEIG